PHEVVHTQHKTLPPVKYLVAFETSAYELAQPRAESPTSRAVISVQKIVHRYDGRTALDGVSFDVRPAELFGLLGPNGSGKTTLFRLLSTLMLPTSGRTLIMGFDAAKESNALRRQIGVVFQAQSIDVKHHANLSPQSIDRKSTRLNSSHVAISYAVFCLKKKKNIKQQLKNQYNN